MKLAHTVIVAPHQNGMYETAREIVAAECSLGHDAVLVSPTSDEEGEDRGVRYVPRLWVRDADAIVNHGGVGKQLAAMGKPVVGMLHGTPHYTFMMEHACNVPMLTAIGSMRDQDSMKAFVTLWPSHFEMWRYIVAPKPLYLIPPCVDLEFWKPVGDGYFYESESINVVVTDQWRAPALSPLGPIAAFADFADSHKNAMLHLYSAPKKNGALRVLLDSIERTGNLGEVKGRVDASDLRAIYNAADMVVTGSPIATRTVREALACGCDVVGYGRYVAGDADELSRVMAEAHRERHDSPGNDRRHNRATARQEFDPVQTATQLLEIVSRYL